MWERTTVYLEFGGTIRQPEWEELRGELSQRLNYVGAQADGSFSAEEPEAAFGNLNEQVTTLLQEHDLTYKWWSDSIGDFGGTLHWWSPGDAFDTWVSQVDGEPILTLSDLERLPRYPFGFRRLDDLITKLTPPVIPPLEVI